MSACLNLGGELSHNIDLSNLKELVVHYTNITVKSIGLILAKTRHLQTLRLGSGLLTGEASDDLLTDLRLDSLKEFDLGWQLLPDFIFERIKSAAPPTLQIKNMHKKRMEKQEVVSNEQLEVEINTSVFNEKMNRICNLLQNDNIKASSKERIQLMHSLLKEQTVTQGYLWVCYKEYAAVFLRQINANNKPQLLAICQELREIHSEQKKISSQEKNQTLPKELTKRLSQYQNSFWITKHRQENATKLQATLQGKTTYKDILNEIVTTRNEVLHHDALEETGMHRFGKSRYYETLNEMEDLLIKAWISDPNAIHEFADYIEIYTSERNDALKTYIDALKQYDAKTYGNIDASVDKRVFSNISRLPGYLRALAVEAKTRDDALCGYQDLLNNASNASPKV